MSHDHRESPMKALLNTLGMPHEMHTMPTGYRNHDTEDCPAPQDSTPLGHTMPRWKSESSEEYSEEPDTHCHLASLQEEFWQLQDQLSHLEPATTILHIWQSWHSLQIHCNTSLWQSIHIQPPSLKRNLKRNYASIRRHLACHRGRQTSPHPYSWISPHSIDKTAQRELAHTPRNHPWHFNWEPHTSSWGEIPWPNHHSHLWDPPSRKLLGRTQGHPSTEALYCKYSYKHFTLYENTTQG